MLASDRPVTLSDKDAENENDFNALTENVKLHTDLLSNDEELLSRPLVWHC
jgi:hypothetical protein